MSKNQNKSVSIESYKGVRDFYPQDLTVENYIFNTWRKTAELFGYQEYNASVLEPAELYRAKSGEEIVSEQTYTFKDRGDREVTLRPEMTPTVARMIAAKKRELNFPVRWFSIPNLFRYEKPQRGRLREHWQLNVDVFGIESLQAEVEVISIAVEIMKNFGIDDRKYEIRLNSRKITNYVLYKMMGLDEITAGKVSKIIDRKEKVARDVFNQSITEAVGEKDNFLLSLLNSENFEEFTKRLPEDSKLESGIEDVKSLIESLEKLGITNVRFDQTLMRGFDYYTGIIFEIFDTNPENRRSLFGGGRYDNLLEIFGEEKIPAFGFGMGDVTIKDVLATYSLLPEVTGQIDLGICTIDAMRYDYTQELAQKLREKKLVAVIDYSGKKIGDQIKRFDKRGTRYIVCIGEEEIKTGKLKVKNLRTGTETEVDDEKLSEFVAKNA